MLATAIVVFHEVLEASLVVGIVLAASRGVPRRGLWVSSGIIAGVLGTALVAASRCDRHRGQQCRAGTVQRCDPVHRRSDARLA